LTSTVEFCSDLHAVSLRRDTMQSTVLPWQVVHSSVTLTYHGHIGWNTSEIMSLLISLGCSLMADPNITGLLQENHPEIPGGIGTVSFIVYIFFLLRVLD